MKKIPADLPKTLGKNIGDYCAFSIGKNNSENHCAHYVSHIMDYELAGAICKNATWADKQKTEKGATIRVNDLFSASSAKGLLSNKPAAIVECLVFVTLASNVKSVGQNLVMKTHPKKHMGILSQGRVWNYSNTLNMVVADLLPVFQAKFSNAYKTTGTTVELYYGKLI